MSYIDLQKNASGRCKKWISISRRNFIKERKRHHLKSHVSEDVNLLDVIEHLVDCTLAGLARSGNIYDTDLSLDLLELATRNTVELIKQHTEVIEDDNIMNQEIT